MSMFSLDSQLHKFNNINNKIVELTLKLNKINRKEEKVGLFDKCGPAFLPGKEKQLDPASIIFSLLLKFQKVKLSLQWSLFFVSIYSKEHFSLFIVPREVKAQ